MTTALKNDCLECRLDLSQIEQNPFHGVAPQTFDQDQNLKFKNVCQVNDESYDFQMSIAAGYWSNQPNRNHVVGNMFRLNLKAGTNASAIFTLVKEDGQPASAEVKILFTLLDLDQGDNTVQWVEISGVFDSDQGPQVTLKAVDGFKYTFESQRVGNVLDNLVHALELSRRR